MMCLTPAKIGRRLGHEVAGPALVFLPTPLVGLDDAGGLCFPAFSGDPFDVALAHQRAADVGLGIAGVLLASRLGSSN